MFRSFQNFFSQESTKAQPNKTKFVFQVCASLISLESLNNFLGLHVFHLLTLQSGDGFRQLDSIRFQLSLRLVGLVPLSPFFYKNVRYRTIAGFHSVRVCNDNFVSSEIVEFHFCSLHRSLQLVLQMVRC